LLERQARLVHELGNRAELEFDPECSKCCSNQELLACAGLQDDLAAVRSKLAANANLNRPSVKDASALMSDVQKREDMRADMERKTASWDEAVANDKDLVRLEDKLASIWWGAYDAQSDALADAKATEERCVRVLDLQESVLAACQEHQTAQRGAADAEANRAKRADLECRKRALQEQAGILLRARSQLDDARKRVAFAEDRLLYSELIRLEARAKDTARALADLQAKRTQQRRDINDCEAWDRHDARLAEIRSHLISEKELVEKAKDLIVGRTGRLSYSAHVYNDIVLPRFREGMNRFLEQTANFQVVCVGNNDLEVRFYGASDNSDFNQLGGADRFLLELAARCALRQIGTPGFNWPIAFVDEGFVAFDASRRSQIAPILAAMVTVGGFEKIVLTSHLASVKAVCMKTLTIERSGVVSRLTG